MSSADGFELTSRPDERLLTAGTEVWCVYEYRPHLAGNVAVLVFESTKIVRRVRNFPPNWRELSDAELLLLKERT